MKPTENNRYWVSIVAADDSVFYHHGNSTTMLIYTFVMPPGAPFTNMD